MCNAQLPGHWGDMDEYEVGLTLRWLCPERRQGEPTSEQQVCGAEGGATQAESQARWF